MRKFVYLSLLILLLAWLATGICQVQPGERLVVRRFGRFLPPTAPGLRIGWPYPIEQFDRVALDRIRRLVVGYQPDRDEEEQISPAGQVLTGDQNLVHVQVMIDYTVAEDRLEQYVLQAGRTDAFLGSAAEALLAEWGAGRSVDDALLRGKHDLPLFLVPRLQLFADRYSLGVIIQGASVPFLYPPALVKMAFDEVNRAQTAILTRENEARQAAERRRLEAETVKFRLEKTAQSYAVEQNLLAYADARRFEQRLEQYRRAGVDKNGYLAALWWEEIGALLAKLKEAGKLDLLDHRLSPDGLDITTSPRGKN